jgi:hypothetical protein
MISRVSALLSSAAFVKLKLPGDDRRLVDQDDLVVGDSVLVVDEDRDARVGDERGRGVLRRFLALVQDGWRPVPVTQQRRSILQLRPLVDPLLAVGDGTSNLPRSIFTRLKLCSGRARKGST